MRYTDQEQRQQQREKKTVQRKGKKCEKNVEMIAQRIFICRKLLCQQVYLVIRFLNRYKHYAINVHQLVISITIVTSPLGYVNLARFWFLFFRAVQPFSLPSTDDIVIIYRLFVFDATTTIFFVFFFVSRVSFVVFPFFKPHYRFAVELLPMSNKANDKITN